LGCHVCEASVGEAVVLACDRHHTLFAVAPNELGPNGTIEPNLCYKLRRILLACCMRASMTVVSRIQLLADDGMEYPR
jgi:hypothetical protein